MLKRIRHVTFVQNNLGCNEESLDMLVGFLLLLCDLETAAFTSNSLDDSHLDALLTLIHSHSKLSVLDLCWYVKKLSAWIHVHA